MRHSFVYFVVSYTQQYEIIFAVPFRVNYGWLSVCVCEHARNCICIVLCAVLCCVVYVFVHYGSAPFSRPFRRRLSANTQRCRRVVFVTHSLSKCWCVRYHRANSNLSGFSRNRTWQQQKKTEIMIFIIGFIEMINEDSGVQGTVCCVLHSTQCRTCHTRRSVSLWLLLIRFVTPCVWIDSTGGPLTISVQFFTILFVIRCVDYIFVEWKWPMMWAMAHTPTI